MSRRCHGHALQPCRRLRYGFSKYAWEILPPNYRPNQVNTSRSPNIRVQGTYTMDASLIKMTDITERVKFQFRLEGFNVLNHWNYMLANVNTTATDPNFGTIIPRSSVPRRA